MLARELEWPGLAAARTHIINARKIDRQYFIEPKSLNVALDIKILVSQFVISERTEGL